VALVAVLADDFAVAGNVLAVMAAEAAIVIVVPEVVGMGLPVQLHLGEGCAFKKLPAPRRRRALGAGYHALHDFLRRGEQNCSPDPRHSDVVSVTVVGSELGRPDDGTDPTGFFNCEFYVGLKPYKDKSWSGEISAKKQLIEAINKKLTAFPGRV
jgi:hypothetical protein